MCWNKPQELVSIKHVLFFFTSPPRVRQTVLATVCQTFVEFIEYIYISVVVFFPQSILYLHIGRVLQTRYVREKREN